MKKALAEAVVKPGKPRIPVARVVADAQADPSELCEKSELSVGEVASRSGLAVSALHFYESRGLIASVRNAGNQRRYPRSVLRRVAVIKVAQRMGVPLAAIAQVCERHGKGLIVDAMSSFAALPIDARSMPFEAVIAASGKCLEGVPGMGFAIARRNALES